MSDSHVKLKLTPENIMKTFKILGLDNTQIRERLNALSEQCEKPLNDKYEIIASDNTSEQKEGNENA